VGDAVLFFGLLAILIVSTPAIAEPPAPVWVEHSAPEWLPSEGESGPAIVSVVDIFNTTDEEQPAWSGTIQWLQGKPGLILCTVEVSFDEPLHENWPSGVRLTLSEATLCQGGVLTQTTDVPGAILALEPAEVWLRSRTNPLDRVRTPTFDRRPANYVLTPSIVESVLGGNPQVMDCFDQAVESGYLDCNKVWVRLEVQPDGTLSSVEPDTLCLFGWPEFDACLRDAFVDTRFPPFEGTPKHVRYPYVVRSQLRRRVLSMPDDPVLP
jgi:hypothetical protein